MSRAGRLVGMVDETTTAENGDQGPSRSGDIPPGRGVGKNFARRFLDFASSVLAETRRTYSSQVKLDFLRV